MQATIFLALVILLMAGLLAPNRPTAQPPQVIYLRADLPELLREKRPGTGFAPLVVIIVAILAVAWMF
jgi:uncharacterized membrane protein